ncbi:MAG: cellulose biosynthesis protein BcsS [Caulobacteraceae bacterium]|nr:cellulose biosynthesis protein BcsS [Caulobacteraceae bacterium]
MIRRCGLALFIILGGGAAAQSSASAAEQGVLFGGGTIASDWSAYGGVLYSLPGSSLGRGWAVRPTVAGGEYKYVTGGQRVRGEYVGGSIALVYQASGDWGWNNLSIGPRYMNTDLSPKDFGNKRRGGRWDGVAGIDGAHLAGPWRVDWYGAYGFDAQDYQVSLDLTHAVGDRWRIGGLIGAQGDQTYDRQMYGALAGVQVEPGFEIQFGAGVTDQSDRGTQGYGQIGFSRTF